MSGNVSEWVRDWYQPHFYKTGPRTDPECVEAGPNRMGRAGHYQYDWRYARSASRAEGDGQGSWPTGGFRVICEIRPPRGR